MAKKNYAYAVYKIYINKETQKELYDLLDPMVPALRGMYIKNAIESYQGGRQGKIPSNNTIDIQTGKKSITKLGGVVQEKRT